VPLEIQFGQILDEANLPRNVRTQRIWGNQRIDLHAGRQTRLDARQAVLDHGTALRRHTHDPGSVQKQARIRLEAPHVIGAEQAVRKT